MDFMAVKKARRRSIFVIDSYLKDSAFTAVKGCKVLNKVCEKSTTCQQRVHEIGTFFVKKWDIKG